MKIQKVLAVVCSVILLAACSACTGGGGETVSSDAASSHQEIEYVSVREYASKGEIYNCPFALQTHPDEIKTAFHYGEETEEPTEDGEAHDHDSEGDYEGDLMIEDGTTVRMTTGSAKYYYRSWLENEGIAFIAYFDDSFSYYIGLTSVQDVLDSVDAEPIYNDIADSENLFFYYGVPENVHQLKYQFGDYYISFFFENDCLSATTIYYAPLWTDYETEELN